MGKGLFTQGLVVLLSGAVPLAALRERLGGAGALVQEVAATAHWEFGGPSLTFAGPGPDGGKVVVDIVARPWPDHMGDPHKEATLMGAWSMGHFGPFAYPYGLQRAAQQAWGWDGAAAAVAGHGAFVRLRSTCAPAERQHDPVAELDFLTGMVQQLLSMPEALCYFNPGGEKLLPASQLGEQLAFNREHGLPPLDAWCNIRMFNVNAHWLLMDTVGNWQLDMADHEAAFPKDQFSPQEVDNFLRNASLYMFEHGDVIDDGDTMDGPGGMRWQGMRFEDAVSSPPRPVMRWLPIDAQDIPAALLQPGDGSAPG